MPRGNIRKYKTQPTYGNKCRASKTARHEYMGVFNRKFGNMKIHRLICEAFHGPQPEGKPIVLHLDEDATNNNPENLRWGTQKENLNMPGFIEYCKSRTGDNNPYTKGMKNKNG